ncbi:hypothetical protein AB0M43_36200 [Longispora sp. NPDC051575]|uniref:hypothetical protein n=1 Tax=Longispora sp. NPDC051575 TaxID=3154943 RepID=UPI003442BAB3
MNAERAKHAAGDLADPSGWRWLVQASRDEEVFQDVARFPDWGNAVSMCSLLADTNSYPEVRLIDRTSGRVDWRKVSNGHSRVQYDGELVRLRLSRQRSDPQTYGETVDLDGSRWLTMSTDTAEDLGRRLLALTTSAEHAPRLPG